MSGVRVRVKGFPEFRQCRTIERGKEGGDENVFVGLSDAFY